MKIRATAKFDGEERTVKVEGPVNVTATLVPMCDAGLSMVVHDGDGFAVVTLDITDLKEALRVAAQTGSLLLAMLGKVK